MIKVENLSKTFGPRTLWSDISFTIDSGEMLAVVGPSGSGKSTLLHCLGLLDRPNSGVILYEGVDITSFRRRDIRRYRRDTLGYLFQNYALIENATVDENLKVALKVQRALRKNSRTIIGEALSRVGLSGRGNEKISHLSGGEQQRVALARLIVQQPTVVLADEPTGALDHANATIVIDVLRGMSKSGCAVAIATHDDRVRDQCDSIFAVAANPLEGDSMSSKGCSITPGRG